MQSFELSKKRETGNTVNQDITLTRHFSRSQIKLKITTIEKSF